jgi:hypothetical protein
MPDQAHAARTESYVGFLEPGAVSDNASNSLVLSSDPICWQRLAGGAPQDWDALYAGVHHHDAADDGAGSVAVAVGRP